MSESEKQKTAMNAQETQPEEEHEYDVYNWEFHKIPILAAGILTVLFYLFVFFWVRV